MSDDQLHQALHALRERTHGRSDDADRTLARILAPGAPIRRPKPSLRWLPAAAVLLLGSAWAAFGDRVQPTRSPSAAAPMTRRAPHDAPVPPAPSVDAPQAADVDPEPAPTASRIVGTAPALRPSPPPVPSAPAPEAPAPPPPEPTPAEAVAADVRDFRSADEVHRQGSPANAVRAWDDYLARHPGGRFAPEARYARAIALLRAGRRDDAAAALTPFANAAEGSYRQADARHLLQSLRP